MTVRMAVVALALLGAGCGRDDRAAGQLRAFTDTIVPDDYDTAVVAAAWRTVDSAVLAQLDRGEPLEDIQRWLSEAEGSTPDATSPPVIPILIAPAAGPVGMGNTIVILGAGSGSDSTVAVTAGLGMVSGPSHFAVLARRGERWQETYRYSSDRHLWLQGRPTGDGAGLIVGMELFVRGDGANARLVGWRVRNGRVTSLPLADTTEIEAGDFLSSTEAIAISSPQYALGLAFSNPDPRVEELWHFSLRGDSLQRVKTPINPWMTVVNEFYLANARGEVRAMRALTTSEALRRQLLSPYASAPEARGDTAAGWGTVDLSLRGRSLRVLVERQPDGVWRISRAMPGTEENGSVSYPDLAPHR